MPPQSVTQKRKMFWWAAALLLGLGLRVIFVILHPRWGGDTFVYGNLAENMLSHHVYGFADPELRSTLIRLPGYPLFLAACFVLFGHANYLAVVCVQVLIDLIGCVLLSVLAGRLWGKRTQFATLWLAALCPFTANYAGAALTETLSIFCVIAALYCFARISSRWDSRQSVLSWSLGLGVALSYATLVRPDEGLLAAAAVPALLWVTCRSPERSWSQRFAPAFYASLVVALPLLLWGARNYRVFGVIQPLAPRQANDPGESVPYGFQRWYRTWGIDYKSTFDVYWNYDGGLLNIKDLPGRAFDTPEQRVQTAELFDRYDQEQSGTPELDEAFARIAQQRVQAHPLRYYFLLPTARVANMWMRPRAELLRVPIDWWNFRAHAGWSAFEAGLGVVNLAYLVMAALGLIAWRRQGWGGQFGLAAMGVAFVLMRCTLLLTLDNSEPRYTLECYPVVILFAGVALSKRRGKRQIVNA